MTTAQNLIAVTFFTGLMAAPAVAETTMLPAGDLTRAQVKEECAESKGEYLEGEGYHCFYPSGSSLTCPADGKGCYFLIEDRVAPPTRDKTGVVPKVPGTGTVLK